MRSCDRELTSMKRDRDTRRRTVHGHTRARRASCANLVVRDSYSTGDRIFWDGWGARRLSLARACSSCGLPRVSEPVTRTETTVFSSIVTPVLNSNHVIKIHIITKFS